MVTSLMERIVLREVPQKLRVEEERDLPEDVHEDFKLQPLELLPMGRPSASPPWEHRSTARKCPCLETDDQDVQLVRIKPSILLSQVRSPAG